MVENAYRRSGRTHCVLSATQHGLTMRAEVNEGSMRRKRKDDAWEKRRKRICKYWVVYFVNRDSLSVDGGNIQTIPGHFLPFLTTSYYSRSSPPSPPFLSTPRFPALTTVASMSDLHRALSGAHRPNSNPRIHRHSSPYKRPLGQSALHPSSTMGDLASLAGRETSPTKKPVPTSRVQSLASGGSLTRSGSEPSLLSGIKSIFTRPLQWLSTPGKTAGGSKRDSLSSFGNELEDPESPSDRREGKRIRRHSPEPRTNRFNDLASDYAPEHQFEVQGRAVSGFMLPPLSPHVTLKPKSSFSNDKTAHRKPANFSRPLTSSQSMSYLDPPSNVLRSSAYGQAVASPKKTGTLTRSKRVDLATLADDDAGFQEDSLGKDDRGKEKEIWSPWKSKYAGANGASSTAAAQKNITPGRKTFAQTLEDGDVRYSFR